MKSPRTGSQASGLSSRVESLVEQERLVPAQTDAVRERLLARARSALELGATAPGAKLRPHAARPLVNAAVGVAVVAGLAAAFQLLGGSAEEPPVRTPPPAPPPQAAPAPVRSSQVTGSPLPDSPAPAAPTTGMPAGGESTEARPPVRPAPSSTPTPGLDELQLLKRARQADARRDYAAVLSLSSEHERTFPAGRLAEEREVLRIKALVGLGRGDQARRAAAGFRRQFPRSVLLRTVDELLASLP